MSGDVEPMKSGENELRRVLGPISAACVVIGAIVGVGIFFTPTSVARLAGSGNLAIFAWSLGGLIALVGSLTFAELGGMYLKSGGQYDILRDAYGAPVAFLFVFCNATAIQAGAIAVIAIVFANNLGVLIFGRPLEPLPALSVAVASIVALAMANICGVRWGSKIQNLTVATKLAALLLIIGLAVVYSPNSDAPSTTAPSSIATPWSGVFSALVPVLFSFGGWQQGLWLAGEIRDPEKNVPRAIFGGVLVVIAVYVLASWAYLRLLGFSGVVESETLAADAVGRVWPNFGSKLVAAAVAISAFGVLNAQLLTGPRLIMAMSRDGRFFSLFARVHSKLGTPALAIGLMAVLGLALLLIAGEKGADRILNGVVFIDSTFFLLTGLSLLVLRRKFPTVYRPVRVPLYPIVPLLFVLGEIAVIAGSLLNEKYRSSSFIGMAWIVVAMAFYAVGFRRAVPARA